MKKAVTYRRVANKLRTRNRDLSRHKRCQAQDMGFGNNGGVSSLGVSYVDSDSDGYKDKITKTRRPSSLSRGESYGKGQAMRGTYSRKVADSASPSIKQKFNASEGGMDATELDSALSLFASDSAAAEAVYGPIGDWDVSGVTDMEDLFKDNTTFNEDIGRWDVSNVTDMNEMFSGATAFNKDVGGWDTSAVTNMREMFRDAAAFNQDVGSWNTAAVANLQKMFQGATVFNQDIGSWNTAAATTMNAMFKSATAFNKDISGWDTGEVLDMAGMFNTASAFDQDISGWDVDNVSASSNFADNTSGDWISGEKPTF